MVSIQLHTYMALIVYVHIVYLAYYLKTGSVELGQGILIPRVTKKKKKQALIYARSGADQEPLQKPCKLYCSEIRNHYEQKVVTYT